MHSKSQPLNFYYCFSWSRVHRVTGVHPSCLLVRTRMTPSRLWVVVGPQTSWATIHADTLTWGLLANCECGQTSGGSAQLAEPEENPGRHCKTLQGCKRLKKKTTKIDKVEAIKPKRSQVHLSLHKVMHSLKTNLNYTCIKKIHCGIPLL